MTMCLILGETLNFEISIVYKLNITDLKFVQLFKKLRVQSWILEQGPIIFETALLHRIKIYMILVSTILIYLFQICVPSIGFYPFLILNSWIHLQFLLHFVSLFIDHLYKLNFLTYNNKLKYSTKITPIWYDIIFYLHILLFIYVVRFINRLVYLCRDYPFE